MCLRRLRFAHLKNDFLLKLSQKKYIFGFTIRHTHTHIPKIIHTKTQIPTSTHTHTHIPPLLFVRDFLDVLLLQDRGGQRCSWWSETHRGERKVNMCVCVRLRECV